MSHQKAPHAKTPLFPVTQEEVDRSTLIPFEQDAKAESQAKATDQQNATPLSARAKPGSVTASVLEAIEQSNMPAPVSRDARVKRPGKPPRRYREQARRLVDTRALDRNAWLAIRQSGIGSSDAAAAVGLHPYKSQLELWLEKTGRQAPMPEPDHQAKLVSPLHWGQVLEPLVADHYARHTGHRVQRVNAILQHTQFVDFTEDTDLSNTFAALQQLRTRMDDDKKEEAKLKHRLQQAMGTAT